MELDIYDWRDFPGRGQIPIHAGTLKRCGLTGHHIFRYSKIWIKHGAVLGPVDPMFPVSGKPRDIGESCMGMIGDSLPEKWGRSALARVLGKLDVGDMDCMSIPDNMRVGSLDFAKSGQTLASIPHESGGIKKILAVALSLDRGSTIPRTRGNVMALMECGTLGGSRPKFPFHDEKGGDWIAKMPAASDPWVDTRIEKAMLIMAENCGIEVPQSHLAEIERVPVLFVRRFDRAAGSRIPFMSAQSLLESEKGQHMRLMSYPKLAQAIRQVSGDDDARALFTRMVFNILIRNTDDHAKNHALIKVAGKWRLSPAYDMIPTAWALDMEHPAFHSMGIGHHGNRGTFENAVSMCGEFGLNREEAEKEWERVSEILGSCWMKALVEARISKRDARKLAPIFKHIKTRDSGLALAE